LIAETFTDTASYVDPLMAIEGHDRIDIDWPPARV